MNQSLVKAEKWFAEMSIRTQVRQTYLMVNRDDIDNLGNSNELLELVKTDTGCNKLFWSQTDDNWLYLDSF